jgi:hypothetical protein
MFDKWFKAPVHDVLHYIGALILVVGLPMNKVLMSTGTIWLAANLLIKADFKNYFSRLKSSTIALLVLIIFLIHLIGLSYTTDMNYALHDINSKLPFFVLPIVLIAFPIHKSFYKDVLLAFVTVVVLTSVTNVILFNFGATESPEDIRYLSQFGSHIRYGVLVLFAVVITTYYVVKDAQTLTRFLLLSVLVWLLFYTLYAQVITAYFNLIALILAALFLIILRIRKPLLKYSATTILGATVVLLTTFLVDYLRPDFIEIDKTTLEEHTALGNKYEHLVEHKITENGTPIMLYICDYELEKEWLKHSEIAYYGYDNKGQLLRGTLFRYMSSMGLRKDAEGFGHLSAEDITNIENGIPSQRIAKSLFIERLEGLRLQVQNYYLGADPSGHSLLQRIEHWRAAIHIINNHFYFGVGTGDAPMAFNTSYDEISSNLHSDYRHRSHNQFLAFWVSFGIIGIMSLLLLNAAIFRHTSVSKNYLYVFFGVLLFLSFLPEDTLETQQGATFIGFFLGFLHKKNTSY